VTEERDTEYVLELGYVPMPAEWRRRTVFGHRGVLHPFLGQSRPAGELRAQRVQERWNGRCLAELVVTVVVAAAEAYDAPPRAPLLILRLLEGQLTNEFE
jgi:hypothetical protein